MIPYICVFLASVFVAAISQVMLKKSALKTYPNRLKEYANPLVVCAYALFVITTLMTIFAYRVVPLSLGPILEATTYVYITFFGVTIFKEKMGTQKAIALALIIAGIVVYALGVPAA